MKEIGISSPYLDPLSDEFKKDRYAVYKWFREQNPLQGVEKNMNGRMFTAWSATTYQDVSFILKDSRFIKEINQIIPPEYILPLTPGLEELIQSQRNQMLFRDPPDHTRLRRLVNQAFTPRIVERLKPRIEEIANQLISALPNGDTFDCVKEFAFPLPVIVIADLLGVPSEDRDMFKKWSSAFIRTIDYNPTLEDYSIGNKITIEFRHYFREIVKQRTEQPKFDLISELIRVRDEEGKLSEDELLDMCILLLVAGHETTVNLIANSIYLFTQNQDQLMSLRQNPELLPGAIEEVLRFESPVQVTSRFVAEDIELSGQILKKGDVVDAWIGSANRDPAKFKNPDSFQISRSPNPPHIAFGQGHHFCLGAPLARQEAIIAIRAILKKYKNFSLAKPVQWKDSPLMRSLLDLPINGEIEKG